MGNLPLKRNKKYRQGYFLPRNPDKLLGREPIIYRSGLELTFFKFLDSNPNVLKWSSESVVIDYIGIDGENHKYYVDNVVVIKEGDTIKKYLIEVKPYKQTLPPVKKKQKKTTLLYEDIQYRTNLRKWHYAKIWAKAHGMEFKIITDKDLA